MRWTPPTTGVRAWFRQGFTLVELMVVMVVIAILTAMVLPEMKGTFEDALLRSAVRDLTDVFGMAQSRSVSLNQTHRVRIDAATGSYHLERRVRSARGGGGFVAVRDLSGAQGRVDERVVIQSGPMAPGEEGLESGEWPRGVGSGTMESTPPVAWLFHPDGTAEGADLVLRDRSGFGLVMQLNPVTGRVRVTEAPKR